MNTHIEKYLDDLREALKGLDRSTIQDALSNSEDHLNEAFAAERAEDPDSSSRDIAARVIEMYGSPEEIRDVYSDIEEHTTPVFALPKENGRSWFQKFLGVAADPGAWAACIYMILSMLTGILYFTVAVTGLSISTSLIVLIIGIPMCLLYFMAVRGIGFVEGRIVEAMLGIRMPRRSVLPGGSFWDKFTAMLRAGSTWKTMVYMVLQMPIGIFYFTLVITLFSLGLGFIGAPVIQYVLHEPFFDGYWVPFYLMPVPVAFGGVVILATLHLVKALGRLHGKYAKAMLVS